MNVRPLIRAALLVLLGVAAGPAAAQDEPPAEPPAGPSAANDAGFAFYEKSAVRILKTAGAKDFEAGDTARKWGLHQFAYEQAQRSLGFDPELKDARAYLGYEKKGEKWVLDAEAAGKVLKQNSKPQNQSQETFDQLIEKWRTEHLKKADEFVAAKYADLGDECLAKGYPDQANKGWEYALALDRDNAKARKGLGFKKFGKVWLTEKQDKARKDAAKSVEVKEESAWDSFFGSKMNKVESLHFRIESPYPVAELMDYAAAAETCYAYYLADFARDPSEDVLGGGRIQFVVMQAEDQWNKFVDAYGGMDKEFTRQMSGTGDGNLLHGIASKAGSNPGGRKDHLVHQTVHDLNKFVWKIRGNHAWVDEGLAYYYTIKVLDTTSTHCVSLKKGNYEKPGDEGGIKAWDANANWKSKIKDLVKAKNDVPLRTLVMQPITQLEFQASVKAWCIATWFMDSDRDKWMETLAQFRDGGKPEPVLEGLWGKGLEELDDAWHAWVKKTY